MRNTGKAALRSIILVSRLIGLLPNLTSRFTPGTLISNDEVLRPLNRDIDVLFRKYDAERQRKIVDLKAADSGLGKARLQKAETIGLQ